MYLFSVVRFITVLKHFVSKIFQSQKQSGFKMNHAHFRSLILLYLLQKERGHGITMVIPTFPKNYTFSGKWENFG